MQLDILIGQFSLDLVKQIFLQQNMYPLQKIIILLIYTKSNLGYVSRAEAEMPQK